MSGAISRLLIRAFSNTASNALFEGHSEDIAKKKFDVVSAIGSQTSGAGLPSRARTPHFFIMSATHVAILISTILLIQLSANFDDESKLIWTAFLLLLSFSAILIVQILDSRDLAKVKRSSGRGFSSGIAVSEDVIIGCLFAMTIFVEESERGMRSEFKSRLCSILIMYMFCLSGLRRLGLIGTFIISQLITVAVLADKISWQQMLIVISIDFICLAFGLNLYFIIYYLATEVLRMIYRPRLCIQDFPSEFLQPLEMSIFEDLYTHLGDQPFPNMTLTDHTNILLHLARLSNSSRSSVLERLAAGVVSQSRTGGKVSSNSKGANSSINRNQIARERDISDPRAPERSYIENKPQSRGRYRDVTAGGDSTSNVAASNCDSRCNKRQKTVTFNSMSGGRDEGYKSIKDFLSPRLNVKFDGISVNREDARRSSDERRDRRVRSMARRSDVGIFLLQQETEESRASQRRAVPVKAESGLMNREVVQRLSRSVGVVSIVQRKRDYNLTTASLPLALKWR